MKWTRKMLAGFLTAVMFFCGVFHPLVVNAAQTNKIVHYLEGFNGEAGTVEGASGYYQIGETYFSVASGNVYTMGQDRAVSPPNGTTLRTTYFCSTSPARAWYYHDFGSTFTQFDYSMNFWYYYDPITYSISYNLNGGTNHASNPTSYNVLYGKTLYAPKRTGYIFNGWTDQYGNKISGINSGCNATFSSITDLYNQLANRRTGNLVLTANWTPDTRYITYDDNGGSGGPGTESFLLGFSYRISTIIPIKTGYTFQNWLDLYSGTSTLFSPGQAYPAGWGSNTMKAQWSPNTYTISLDAQSEKILYRYEQAGYYSDTSLSTSITSISVPQKEGFTFTRYYYNWSDGTKETYVYSDGKIAEDLCYDIAWNASLTSEWSRNKYKVTYDACGGSFETGTDIQSTDTFYDYPIDLSPKASKSGRIFLGWAESPDAKVCLSSKVMPAEDVTLYAIYSLPVSDVKEAYFVAWNKNNPSDYNVFEINMTEQDVNGYYYKICGINAIEGLNYTESSEISLAIVLYDHAGNKSIIPVVLNETNPTPDVEQIPLHQKYLQTVEHYLWNLEANDWVFYKTTEMLVEEGSLFQPEFIEESEEFYPKGYYGDEIAASYVVCSETTSKAYYKPHSYQLYFEANGGSCVMTEKTIYPDYYFGELPIPVREGYNFLGWYTEKDGGKQIFDSDKFEGHEDLTVYAHWSIKAYTVLYDSVTNGGTSSNIEMFLEYGNSVDLSVEAEKPGWQHVGWNTNPNATEGLSNLTMKEKKLQLYAIYQKEISATFIDQTDSEIVTRKESATLYNRESAATVEVPIQNKITEWNCLGWSLKTDANAEIQYASGNILSLVDSIILYGCYEKEIVVYFETNGAPGMLEDMNGKSFYNASNECLNPTFLLPSGPSYTGYSFVGWEEKSNEEFRTIYEQGQEVTFEEDVILSAKWDKFPEIEAYDRYFTLEAAKKGLITEAELLKKVKATDLEDGILINGTNVIVQGYQEKEFTEMTEENIQHVTYQARDSFGNIVNKEIAVYIVDTANIESSNKSYMRFIDEMFYKDKNGDYISTEDGGLEETSIWITHKEYANLLDIVLKNKKKNISYTQIHLWGKTYQLPVLSSGEWTTLEEVWNLDMGDIYEVKSYIKANGYGKYQSLDSLKEFREKFKNQ